MQINGLGNNTRTVGGEAQAQVLMAIIAIGLVGAVGLRLVYLQLLEGTKYRQRAEDNRVRIVAAQRPTRGNILDRRGRMLVSNRNIHSVFVWPAATKKPTWLASRQRLAEVLGMSEAEIQEKVQGLAASSPQMVRLEKDLTPDKITALKEFSTDTDGINVEIEAVRYYPHGELASHVLGYTGELTKEELEKRRTQGYRVNDLVGKMGAEASFEELLRGEWGGRQIEVDGANRLHRDLGQKISRPGQDIRLTIDLDLQKTAEEALGKRAGSIVAMNPNTGEILAMVSKPGFDPNVFSGRIKPEEWKKLQDENFRLVNRSMQAFPPASTFKIVTTTAALESGKYSADTKLQTYASLNISGTRFADWNHKGFGVLGFPGALKWSSDTFFYQIAQGVGETALIDSARKYGLGSKTGIDLPSERRGLVADQDWKQKNFQQNWTIGDTVNMSIGQGYLQATPLQITNMFAAIANGGYLVKPHVLTNAPIERKPINIKPETLQVIRQGLREVVDGGTGGALNSPTIPASAGKSGTAEVPPKANHIWFGGYAPLNQPEIVVVAFGEHLGKEGGGGKVAAPMVLKVMETYFNFNKSQRVFPPSSPSASAQPRLR